MTGTKLWNDRSDQGSKTWISTNQIKKINKLTQRTLRRWWRRHNYKEHQGHLSKWEEIFLIAFLLKFQSWPSRLNVDYNFLQVILWLEINSFVKPIRWLILFDCQNYMNILACLLFFLYIMSISVTTKTK